MYERETNRINFAILNFSATLDALEQRRECSSAKFLEEELRSRLSSERLNVTEIFILQILLSTVLFYICSLRFAHLCVSVIITVRISNHRFHSAIERLTREWSWKSHATVYRRQRLLLIHNCYYRRYSIIIMLTPNCHRSRHAFGPIIYTAIHDMYARIMEFWYSTYKTYIANSKQLKFL